MSAVRRFLDLSTAHLSLEDRVCLDRSADHAAPPNVSCGIMPFGWFVYAHDDRPEVSDPLWALMQEARRQGCDYLLFDRDAATLDGFPSFDWDDEEI